MKNNAHIETNIESWLSQQEDKLEPHPQEGSWMQSKPEDSMGHMHGGHNMKMGNLQGISHDMNMHNQTDSKEMQQLMECAEVCTRCSESCSAAHSSH